MRLTDYIIRMMRNNKHLAKITILDGVDIDTVFDTNLPIIYCRGAYLRKHPIIPITNSKVPHIRGKTFHAIIFDDFPQ